MSLGQRSAVCLRVCLEKYRRHFNGRKLMRFPARRRHWLPKVASGGERAWFLIKTVTLLPSRQEGFLRCHTIGASVTVWCVPNCGIYRGGGGCSRVAGVMVF